MLKRKNPFQIAFDPSRQPGFQTRCATLQGFTGGAQPSSQIKRDHSLDDREDLVKKFNSGSVWQTLPSSKGKRS